uniref:Spectrin repeat containing, nuclear envelope 2b n=1 Tax=Astyanax mexicanus TaxID=7994 RepID=A0A3B1JBV8_ASTMX
VRKLKETLVMVQQLDKNMSNLRTWLSRIEGQLSKPVVYSICHGDEIQRKLAEQQQELQRDIEQHTEGVASVLTLCDVLLHDADACGSDVENDSIQQTTRSLDRRWRNICAMSMERRMIEETWRLWRKFLEDYSRFEVWLTTAEQTAANPASTDVLYTCAKEELKKFEAFQRQVHERLTQLELVNKQYRRLARENRTDTSNKLKTMVNEGNQRWDTLQRRVPAWLRRLKHFTSQREEFEGTREAILVWLTEMDLQLTNVEHFSESDIHDKMRQLNLQAFQQEITLNTNKIDALIVFGENLIQKSSPLDAVLIEDELEELHSYCQEVFGRVARFHHRLINRRPVLDDDHDFSDRDTDVEDSLELGSVWAEEEDLSVHDLLPPLLEPSGRETPVSVNSIPLEWDHTVDVGGSSSPEDEDEEDVTYYSALSGVIERWELLQAQEAADLQQWHKLTTDLIEVTAWLDGVLPELETLRRAEEMQRTFNIYKSLMIGVNLSGQDIQRGDRAELQELSAGLHATNQKWTHACAVLDSWQYQLHNALLQCQTLHSLLLWLARAESQRYMVNIHDLNVDTNILEEHRDALKDLQQELRGREQEVLSLQEMSAHILQLDQGEDSLEAKEKVHVISNKLRLLLRQVAQDLGLLQRPFLYRVLRAAFPLHLLFLMLLVLACLVPLSEDDYSCALSNNFARSFYPMLRYINGPPPT